VSHHAARPSRGALDELRASAAAAVATHTLRRIAQQVGMSAGGLRKFLDGAAPTPPVYRKLRAWHDRRRGAEPDGPEVEPAAPRTRRLGRADPPEDAEMEVDLAEVPRVVLRFTPPRPD
jgi:hypothetical protein